MKKFIKAPAKFYFHYPFPVTIVATKYEDKVNMMSAVWHTQLSFAPPLYGVLISRKRYTHSLIEKSRVFTLNFVDYEFVETVAFVGSVSGRDYDKAHVFDIPLEDGRVVDAPVLSESYAAYECELYDMKEYGDHTLFVGKIVGVHYDSELYNGEKYQPNIGRIFPVLYLGSDTYVTTDSTTKKKYTKQDVLEFIKKWQGE
ncbi:MAG: flavin reductase family protein [Thermotogaceae bacterium]|nr:flavin reductase family protein [Thermotogaceae bacterium]